MKELTLSYPLFCYFCFLDVNNLISKGTTMLSTSELNHTHYPESNQYFGISEIASDLIDPASNSLNESVVLLMDNKHYADAAVLVAINLPTKQGIDWLVWCNKIVSRNQADTFSYVLNHNFNSVQTPDSVLRKLNSQHPRIWLEAANYWYEQYVQTSDLHLYQMTKEALVSATLLTMRCNTLEHLDFLRFLDRGISLLQD